MVKDVLDPPGRLTSSPRVLRFLEHCESTFEIGCDVALIPLVIDYLQDQIAGTTKYDNSEITRIGLVVREAILDAMHRGVQQCGTDHRSENQHPVEHCGSDCSSVPADGHRRIVLTASTTPKKLEFVIREVFVESETDANRDRMHERKPRNVDERGLAFFRSFMDVVFYAHSGNELHLIKDAIPDAV